MLSHTFLLKLFLFPNLASSALTHLAAFRESAQELGSRAPATSIQSRKLRPRTGNEAGAGLGGLGPGKRLHQDISDQEHSHKAAETKFKVSHGQTLAYAYRMRSNVHTNTHSLKPSNINLMSVHRVTYSVFAYRPPVSRIFTVSIPQIIVSPGTSASIAITFRPLQRVKHHNLKQNCIK